MQPIRRHLTLALLALGSTALFATPAAQADDHTIAVLVGYAPGGAVDTVARVVAEGLNQEGYQAIIENRAGAAGRIAASALARAEPDGKTLMLSPTGNLTLAPHVVNNMPYDPLADFTAVGSAGRMSFALAVGPDSPAADLQEFLALAKEDPAMAAYGTPGTGTAMHFIGSMLSDASGVPLTQIPYKGGSAAVTDAIGGTIPAVITTLPNLLPMHRDGRLRILAISNPEPVAALPNVPTFKSLGYDNLVVTETFIFFAPAGTPAETVADLNQAITAAVQSPRVSARLQEAEYEVHAGSPETLNAEVRDSHAAWADIVARSGHSID